MSEGPPMTEARDEASERKRRAHRLYDEFFSPERKREMALAYLSLCDDGYEPSPLICDIVLEWLGGNRP